MKIIQILKQKNRTILEMFCGTLFYGIVCQVIGAVFAKNQPVYAISLWLGIILSMVATLHMYKTIDRALDFGEEDAAKLLKRGFIIRYVVFCIVIAVICLTKVLNPLVTFLGYMSLKGTVYLQPFTHKLCNKFFHETDPIPEPILEEIPVESEDVISDTPKENE